MQDNPTNRRWGGWHWLVPVVGLFVHFAASAQGTFLHQQFVTPDPNPWFPWDLQGQRVMGGPTVSVQWGLDMNSDGQTDFTFVSHEGESFQVVPNGNNAVLSYTFGPGGMNAWALPRSSLTPISADPGGYTWFHRLDSPFPSIPDAGAGFVAYTSELSIGTFLGVESAYVGLQFNLEDGLHYGWARVGCPVTGLGGGWIYECAYETRPDTLILTGAGADSDHDGVWDSLDQCPGSPMGAVVDTNGCSIAQCAPCEGPWKNHGEYVKAVEQAASRFVQARLITEAGKRGVLKQAAASDCGKPKSQR